MKEWQEKLVQKMCHNGPQRTCSMRASAEYNEMLEAVLVNVTQQRTSPVSPTRAEAEEKDLCGCLVDKINQLLEAAQVVPVGPVVKTEPQMGTLMPPAVIEAMKAGSDLVVQAIQDALGKDATLITMARFKELQACEAELGVARQNLKDYRLTLDVYTGQLPISGLQKESASRVSRLVRLHVTGNAT